MVIQVESQLRERRGPEVGVELDFRVPQFDVHLPTTVDNCTLDDRCQHSLQSFAQIFNQYRVPAVGHVE